jgi:hypothetical protein
MGTDSRRPVHLVVLVGVSASAYAISLAGVAMLQSTADRALIEDRAPVDAAARGVGSAHDALDQVVDDAARAYSASADRYSQLSDRLGDVERQLDALSTSVATVAGAANALPTRISLPKVSVSVPKVAKPKTHATTGASG